MKKDLNASYANQQAVSFYTRELEAYYETDNRRKVDGVLKMTM